VVQQSLFYGVTLLELYDLTIMLCFFNFSQNDLVTNVSCHGSSTISVICSAVLQLYDLTIMLCFFHFSQNDSNNDLLAISSII
jgi:hypothetical protein